MAITYEAVKTLSAQLYEWSLKKIPEDSKAALEGAMKTERNDSARKVLGMMRKSAEIAESEQQLICSDAGVPTYLVKIGTAARLDGDIKQAFVDGFAHLVKTIQPPILAHVTTPFSSARLYEGKDMPLVSWDVESGADYLDITCSPKALGAGRWGAMEIFTFAKVPDIERYVLECVVKAGSQTCPPVVVGVGFGGTMDFAVKLAVNAALRPIGTHHAEPEVAAMEKRLLKAVNETGFGPMGTGGDTTALAVHVDYASGHGYTPVAVYFNCWINRRTRARLYNDGRVERIE